MGREVKPIEEEYDRTEIIQMIKSTSDTVVKSLLSILYLTGTRISECLELKKKHIKFRKLKVGKKVKMFMVVRLRTLKKWKYNLNDGEKLIDYRSKGLNPPTKVIFTYRQVPVPIEYDGFFVRCVKEHMDNLNDQDLLFKFTRKTAWLKIKELGKNIDVWIHLLRHVRAKELVTKYNFVDQDLIKFFGWADSRPAARYISLNWKDIAKKMRDGSLS